jgi:hypothetical protein
MIKHFFLALAAATLLAFPAGAQAQALPSYASGAPQSLDENIHGRIVAFDGAYALSVRDEKGYIDNIQLHQGTIINPTGLTLASGMTVSVLGYNAGSYFSANEIDTPYHFYGAVPYYAGHPWNYYGPSISLSFFFGSPGWWHGNAFGGGFRYVGGARVYNNVHITTVYRGGAFHGHDFVAPRERGGYYHGQAHAMAEHARGGGGHAHGGGGGDHHH